MNKLSNKVNLNTVGVYFMIVSSLVLISLAFSYGKQVKNNNFRTFSVTAEGKSIATPDVAQFTFTVFTRGGLEVSESEQSNAERVRQVLDFLKANNISDDDIKTESYNVEPRYTSVRCENGICPPSEIEGYTVSQTNSVKVRNFTDVTDLLTGVAALNVDNLSQLSFVVDDKLEYENLAREEAISIAQDKAKAIAKAAGFRLGRITSIYEDNYFHYDMGGMESTAFNRVSAEPLAMPVMDVQTTDLAEGVSSDSSFGINPGTSEIKVRMTLNYSIK